MALILDTDLLCVERGGRSYKWTGAELKGQITGLSPIAQITGTDPIIVTQTGRDATISIRDATTGQKGATILTNTVDTSETRALTPKGAKTELDLKANANGSNATGTWNINITGNSPGSDNSTNSVNTQNVKIDTDSGSNANRVIVFADGASGGTYRLKADAGLLYNPSTNTITANTFTGNLNGTASVATSATNAVNSTNATNATNVNILTDSSNSTRYLTFSSTTSGNDRVRVNTALRYNPSTNALIVTGNISGSNISGQSLSVIGNINAGGDVISASDKTIKKDIQPIENALESLKKVNGVKFAWNSTGKRSMGVIAQEVEEVFPDIVKTEAGIRSVTYNGLVGALIEAVKELSARVEELESTK